MITLHMIAAVSQQTGAIGLLGKIPWHKPDDLRLFKKVTENSIVIAGKRTSLGLPELLNREIATWDGKIAPIAFLAALKEYGVKVAWLIGGAHTYEKFAPHVNGLRLISYVDYDGPFDTAFPFSAYGLPELIHEVEKPAW